MLINLYYIDMTLLLNILCLVFVETYHADLRYLGDENVVWKCGFGLNGQI